jgi:hypothetical protein
MKIVNDTTSWSVTLELSITLLELSNMLIESICSITITDKRYDTQRNINVIHSGKFKMLC